MSPEERVYAKLCEVPRGMVTTYGELARAAGLDGGQRAVGQMMARNPYPGIVPCHRVVRSDGAIGGYAYGAASKKAMLDRDGICVNGEKIDDFGARLFRF